MEFNCGAGGNALATASGRDGRSGPDAGNITVENLTADYALDRVLQREIARATQKKGLCKSKAPANPTASDFARFRTRCFSYGAIQGQGVLEAAGGNDREEGTIRPTVLGER